MTKEELKNRISLALKDPILQQGFEIICKNLAELEEKISNLLSCKNCSENKGGYICEKEYENKCLTQKIQFIKELQEDIAELKNEKCELLGIIQGKDKAIQDLQKEIKLLGKRCNQLLADKGKLTDENTKLKTDYKVLSCSVGDFGELQDKLDEEQRKNNELSDSLTKAKDLIKQFLEAKNGEDTYKAEWEAEQFLSEVK